MRKTTTFKLLMALGIAAASVFGLFHATVQPAEASLICPRRIQSCNFTGIVIVPGGACCTYLCPSGQVIEGPCEHD
jgi:hypothetical protein